MRYFRWNFFGLLCVSLFTWSAYSLFSLNYEILFYCLYIYNNIIVTQYFIMFVCCSSTSIAGTWIIKSIRNTQIIKYNYISSIIKHNINDRYWNRLMYFLNVILRIHHHFFLWTNTIDYFFKYKIWNSKP